MLIQIPFITTIKIPAGYFYLAIIGCCLFWVSGCDNSIDPLDEERGIYSIYGGLNVNSDINYIRVRDLNVPIREGERWEFDGTVSITNKNTSETQVLNDTLVSIDDIYVWNFESTMPIEPETVYEVTAEKPDGRHVTATATTPNITEVQTSPEFPDCLTPITIDIEPVKTGRIEAELGFRWLGQILWLSVSPGIIGPGESPERYRLRLTPRELITERLDTSRWCHQLPEDLLYLRYTHFGPDFSEATISDTLNIPGGAGNLGAYYNDVVSFTIDTTNVCEPFC